MVPMFYHIREVDQGYVCVCVCVGGGEGWLEKGVFLGHWCVHGFFSIIMVG